MPDLNPIQASLLTGIDVRIIRDAIARGVLPAEHRSNGYKIIRLGDLTKWRQQRDRRKAKKVAHA